MNNPKDLLYTKDHEWARVEGETAVIGITAFAVEQLGDITLVELPAVGDAVKGGDTMGTVESVKAVSDLYAPVSGTVIEVNGALEDEPEMVNEAPFEGGWMIKVKLDGPDEIKGLMDADAYAAHCEEGGAD